MRSSALCMRFNLNTDLKAIDENVDFSIIQRFVIERSHVWDRFGYWISGHKVMI